MPDGSAPEPTGSRADGLYRPEALEHARNRLTGEVMLATPLSLRFAAAVLLLPLVAGAVWLTTSTFSRTERVAGWMSTEAGLIRVQARQPGEIREINVSEGQAVQEGQPIARIQIGSNLAKDGDAFNGLMAGISTEGGAAADRARAQIQGLQIEIRTTKRRLATTQRQLTEIRARIRLQTERSNLAREDARRASELADRGVIPLRDRDARLTAALIAEQEVSTLRSSEAAMESELAEAEAQLAEIPLNIRAAEADAAAATARIDQTRLQTEANYNYVVAAPIDGEIAALPVRRGQAIANAGAVAVIAPKGARLEAELYAPSTAIGAIKPGQEVRLMYQAFPYQKYGTFPGRVVAVSTTALQPDDLAAFGVKTDQPMFRVTVRPLKNSVQAYGEALPVRAGSLVAADVVVDERSFLEWLLDPLYAAGRRVAK